MTIEVGGEQVHRDRLHSCLAGIKFICEAHGVDAALFGVAIMRPDGRLETAVGCSATPKEILGDMLEALSVRISTDDGRAPGAHTGAQG